MPHAVCIDDAYGDLIDIRAYCSDECARTDDAYAGWNGLIDFDFDTWCDNCNEMIDGIYESAYPPPWGEN